MAELYGVQYPLICSLHNRFQSSTTTYILSRPQVGVVHYQGCLTGVGDGKGGGPELCMVGAEFMRFSGGTERIEKGVNRIIHSTTARSLLLPAD